MRTQLLALLALAVAACTDKLVPPPATPSRVLPAVAIDPGPPDPTLGRIAFDVVDGPASVDAILAQERWQGTYVSGAGERTRHICDTPCVVNLPRDTYTLRFTLKDTFRFSQESVVVGANPSVYRYAVGNGSPPMGKIWGVAGLAVAGAIATVFGGVELALGNGGAGGVLLGVGLGMDVGSILLFQSARRWKQPGAVQQWTPDQGDVFTVR